MKSKILKAVNILLFSIFCTMTSLFAQPSMQEQYQELYKNSSTWEEYKMIKLNALNQFWSVVTDTLNQNQQTISAANDQISELNGQLAEIKTQLASSEVALEESQSLNNSISFVGQQMSKTAYNILVWLIIIALIVGIGAVFLMFQRSNTVTMQTRRTFENLEREYYEHKDMAREKQIKLRRELQTALNKLSEHRV